MLATVAQGSKGWGAKGGRDYGLWLTGCSTHGNYFDDA